MVAKLYRQFEALRLAHGVAYAELLQNVKRRVFASRAS